MEVLMIHEWVVLNLRDGDWCVGMCMCVCVLYFVGVFGRCVCWGEEVCGYLYWGRSCVCVGKGGGGVAVCLYVKVRVTLPSLAFVFCLG